MCNVQGPNSKRKCCRARYTTKYLSTKEFSPSYTTNRIPLIGTALTAVIPHPAYIPRTPWVAYIRLKVAKKPAGVESEVLVERRGLPAQISSEVCIALFTVSAGYDTTVPHAPAIAPDTADSQGRISAPWRR